LYKNPQLTIINIIFSFFVRKHNTFAQKCEIISYLIANKHFNEETYEIKN